jgi:hypothetical protein
VIGRWASLLNALRGEGVIGRWVEFGGILPGARVPMTGFCAVRRTMLGLGTGSRARPARQHGGNIVKRMRNNVVAAAGVFAGAAALLMPGAAHASTQSAALTPAQSSATALTQGSATGAAEGSATASAREAAVASVRVDAWGQLRNVGLDACLDAAAGDGTSVEECDRSRSQSWVLDQYGPYQGAETLYRIRKNDDECADLEGGREYARLTLRGCDEEADGQFFRLRQAGWDVGSVYLYSVDYKRLLKASEEGEAPFVSARNQEPLPNATWSFRPLG